MKVPHGPKFKARVPGRAAYFELGGCAPRAEVQVCIPHLREEGLNAYHFGNSGSLDFYVSGPIRDTSPLAWVAWAPVSLNRIPGISGPTKGQ